MTLRAPLRVNVLENCSTEPRELARRATILAGYGAAATVCWMAPLWTLGSIAALGVARQLFRFAGFTLQQNGYTHVRGDAPEKVITDGRMKATSWNICGVAGGLPFDHGGVVSWRLRVDRICARIIAEDSDVVILNEVYDTALCEAIISRLKGHYAHFYCHLGANTMGSVGGLMVLSKCKAHSFSNTDFSNNTWTLTRGFATLEIEGSDGPIFRIIGTHLIHKHDRQGLRDQQWAEIVASLDGKDELPTIVMGDMNTQPDQAEAMNANSKSAFEGEKPITRTNRGKEIWTGQAQEIHEESIDDVRLLHGAQAKPKLLHAFEGEFDSTKALSDHHGITVDLEF